MAKISPNLVRRLPGIGWRQEELDKRKAEIADLRAQVRAADKARAEQLRKARAKIAKQATQIERLKLKATPANELNRVRTRSEKNASFAVLLSELRRLSVAARSVDPDFTLPMRHLTLKLHNYRLAASHGVAVPDIYRVWATREQIELSDLPEKFVIKSDGGASGKGVLPLIRVGADAFELADGTKTFSAEQVRSHLTQKSLKGPYFAEQFLDQPSGGAIPDDIKLYAFYGDVQMTLLRAVPEHAKLATMRRRYLAADGTDLGDVMPGATVDSNIAIPRDYAAMIEQAAHLSRAAGTAFVRVDFYQTGSGPVLGELTRAPGEPQLHAPSLDRAMGQAWDRARLRLETDIAHGRPYGRLYGDHPAPNPYPKQHWTHDPGHLAWAPREQPCGHWCRPG
ncbi:hypothetical protein K0651_08300 [Ornithinimicrobium sp. Arc0846-15]|nr:hypothetical protein [Ornithinimicrobium laminariae]